MNLTAVYYILTAVFAGGAFLCFYRPSKRKTTVFIISAALLMLSISALRYGIGFDYNTYAAQYGEIASKSIAEFMMEYHSDIGFCVFMKLCTFISKEPAFFFFASSLVVSVLTAVCVKVFIDESLAGFSMYFFMTMGFFYGSMNLIRQYTAALISVFSIKFMRSRKFIPFLCIVIAAALFHKSALILIPVYFIANIRLNRRTVIIYGVGTAFMYLFSEPVLKFITKYVYSYYDVESSLFMQGTGNIYIVVPLIIFILAFIMRDKLDPIFVNYSLFSLILHILMTKHFILERLAIYFSITYIFLLPGIIAALYSHMKYDELAYIQAKQTAKAQRGGLQKQLRLSADAAKSYRDSKSFFIAGVVFLMCISFVYQILAQNLNFHGVFPYQMIL